MFFVVCHYSSFLTSSAQAVSLIRQDDGIIDPVPSTQALESILYLCSYKETKKDLVKSDDGAWLRTILEMVERPKNISRCGYAIAQIACSLVTSEDDLRIELDLDSDEEKLRKLASRGLPDSKEQEAALRLVGSVDDINVNPRTSTALSLSAERRHFSPSGKLWSITESCVH